jgi:hypothetical protein
MTSLINSINSKVETDVNSDGFITAVFVAARALANSKALLTRQLSKYFHEHFLQIKHLY